MITTTPSKARCLLISKGGSEAPPQASSQNLKPQVVQRTWDQRAKVRLRKGGCQRLVVFANDVKQDSPRKHPIYTAQPRARTAQYDQLSLPPSPPAWASLPSKTLLPATTIIKASGQAGSGGIQATPPPCPCSQPLLLGEGKHTASADRLITKHGVRRAEASAKG